MSLSFLGPLIFDVADILNERRRTRRRTRTTRKKKVQGSSGPSRNNTNTIRHKILRLHHHHHHHHQQQPKLNTISYNCRPYSNILTLHHQRHWLHVFLARFPSFSHDLFLASRALNTSDPVSTLMLRVEVPERKSFYDRRNI